MAQLYKSDYRRYGAQLPIDIADEVDAIAKERRISAAQVISEQMRRALFGFGLCSAEEMANLRNDQLALLRASRMAMQVLYGDSKSKDTAAKELAEYILSSTVRNPVAMAAETAQAEYAADTPLKLAEAELAKRQRPKESAAESKPVARPRAARL